MPLAYSITSGISAEFISYCLIKTVKGKAKEVQIAAYIITALFLLNYVLTALGRIAV